MKIKFRNDLSSFFLLLVPNSNGNNKLVVRRRKSSSSIDEIDGGRPIFTPSAPSVKSSLLVQSLIASICNFFENDNLRAKELTQKLCKKLWESNMIDNSYERPEFEGIRLQYTAAIESLIKIIKESALPIQRLEAVPLKNESNKLEWSRYFNDFTELEKISQGGFGEVFKAQHKIDNHIYAIKKILINSDHVNTVLSHFKEVKTFASLNHLHVVAYKSCWLEPLIFYQPKIINEYDESTMTDLSDDRFRVTKSNEDSLRLLSGGDSSSFEVTFERSQGTVESDSQHTEMTESQRTDTTASRSQLEAIRKLNSTSGRANAALVPHIEIAWSVLYIQMKLCQKTLKNFLDERNSHSNFLKFYHDNNLKGESPNAITLNIFLQICSGLEYIHSKSIVHHDLKPSNVFISFDHDVPIFQLGDFGLACPLEDNKMTRHDGFGTRLYAAKEQIEGKICTKKSDIYSLGIIFVELISKCVTVMECSKKVDYIKKGEKIDDIDAKLCHLIAKLLTVKYEQRPCINDLRDEIKLLIENDEISKLKHIITAKDKEIEELRDQILKLKREYTHE